MDRNIKRLFTSFSQPVGGGGGAEPQLAFTLAEVLITLGVIGIVCAITIPTLISNNQKRITETKLKAAYTLFSNTVSMSEISNGSSAFWDYNLSSEEYTKKYFSPYLKVIMEVYPNDKKYYFSQIKTLSQIGRAHV